MNQLFKQQIQKYGVRVYWNYSTGLRDPHYFEVDPDAVFDIIKNDLDPLKKAIDFFMEQLFPNMWASMIHKHRRIATSGW
jgi:uncharacterized protein with HEPN domain